MSYKKAPSVKMKNAKRNKIKFPTIYTSREMKNYIENEMFKSYI